MLLDTGLVFLSNSCTNAGVDQVNYFRKTTVFERPGDRPRLFNICAAGNFIKGTS
jgi:putative proteasome-type protease